MAQVIPNAITPVQIQELRDYYDTKQVDAHTLKFDNDISLILAGVISMIINVTLLTLFVIYRKIDLKK